MGTSNQPTSAPLSLIMSTTRGDLVVLDLLARLGMGRLHLIVVNLSRMGVLPMHLRALNSVGFSVRPCQSSICSLMSLRTTIVRIVFVPRPFIGRIGINTMSAIAPKSSGT